MSEECVEFKKQEGVFILSLAIEKQICKFNERSEEPQKTDTTDYKPYRIWN